MSEIQTMKHVAPFFSKQPFWEVVRQREDSFLYLDDQKVQVMRYCLKDGAAGLNCIPGVGQMSLSFSVQEKEARAYVFGVLPEKREIIQPGIRQALMLYFSPGGFTKMTGASAVDISADGLPLEDIFPWARPFIEEINSVDSEEEHHAALEKFLTECVRKRTSAGERERELASSVAAYMMKHRRMIRNRELEEEYGFCTRTLQKAVVNNVGITPKQLNLQICLQNAVQTLEKVPGCSLAELTYQMQFYDQSHFGGMFRRMTGFCPGQYLKWQQEK